ncbi:MAG: ribosomal RNA small subunit methyltransferase A [Phycisphaeraceae bacterium]|nr:ribosomal RNA small subunit methyltransferase A [Phycisphaerales bacterium]MCB9859014.1 ribosomal RNA small subunit methyltransferase A [Phycisphaeraceae bacterium]
MQTLSQIRDTLNAYDLSPTKRFGQNFLIDHNKLSLLVDAAGVGTSCKVVLEIGPGTGTLTETMLDHGATVIASEIDHGMCRLLRGTITNWPDTFALIEGDCLASKSSIAPEIIQALDDAMRAHGTQTYRLVANLPYAVSTPVLLALITQHPKCDGMFVTIQNEVADRLLAQPNTKEYGTLGIVAQTCCTVERFATLPPSCFWPAPDVTSAMVAIRRKPESPSIDPSFLAIFCRDLFARRRKQLAGALKAMGYGGINFASIAQSTARAENLSPEQITELALLVSDCSSTS